MTGAEGQRLNKSGPVAAALVIAALVAGYVLLSGEHSLDWVGYRILYDGGGAWLLQTGRDGLFVKLLELAYGTFGFGGYQTFRLAVFLVILAVATRTAFVIPEQPAIGWFSPIAAAAVLVTTFMLKGLVQIREGLAFVFVLFPVVAMYGLDRRGLLRTAVGSIIATTIHAAEGTFLALWAPALIVSRWPKAVADWRVSLAVTLCSLAAGAGFAWWLSGQGAGLLWALRDYSVDASAEPTMGAWKDVYWAFNGLCVLVLRHQVLGAVAGSQPFAKAWAAGLVCGVLPALYVACFGLATTGFAIPAVTSIAIRLLFTSMELSLMIIALRGRMNMLTIIVVGAMFVDRARLAWFQA